MNYKVITDEEKLREFIDWLPELQPEEKFYCCLFARNKYCKELVHIKSDKAQLKRFVSDKERLYWKIKQLEIEVGAYRQKDVAVPQEALALYINPNPRNMYKAAINTMVKIAQCVRDTNNLMNVHQEALSEIQKAKSRTVYVDFDADFKEDTREEDVIALVHSLVNPDAVSLLRTRGGMHILVKPQLVRKEYQRTFYMGLGQMSIVDQSGDCLIPIPGTSQGNFTPFFLCK